MVDRKDFQVKVGKGYDPLTVLELLGEVQKAYTRYGRDTFPDARQNELYTTGLQRDAGMRKLVIGNDTARFLGGDDDPDSDRNHLRSLKATYGSDLVADRQTVYPWPGDAGVADRAAVEMARSYMEYQHQDRKSVV